MKKKLIMVITMVCIVMAASACGKKNEYKEATKLFEEGSFEEALEHFRAAAYEEEAAPSHFTAYCFDLAILERYEECLECAQSFSERDTFGTYDENVRRDTFFLIGFAAYRLGDYDTSVAGFKEMKLITDDTEVRNNIDAYILRAYFKLFADSLSDTEKIKVLYGDITKYIKECDKALNGTVYEFMAGMSLYMYDNCADMRAETDFLAEAENYIDCADRYEDAITRNLEKYSIIIAERRGKTDVAYKLLDVFLTHFPDDESAILEQSFLVNRMGGKAE